MGRAFATLRDSFLRPPPLLPSESVADEARCAELVAGGASSSLSRSGLVGVGGVSGLAVRSRSPGGRQPVKVRYLAVGSSAISKVRT